MRTNNAAAQRTEAGLTREERRRFLRGFAARICMFDQVTIYWRPALRDIAMRNNSPVPPDAVLVGTYAHPFSARDFIEDLNDVIAKLAVQAARATGSGT